MGSLGSMPGLASHEAYAPAASQRAEAPLADAAHGWTGDAKRTDGRSATPAVRAWKERLCAFVDAHGESWRRRRRRRRTGREGVCRKRDWGMAGVDHAISRARSELSQTRER